MYRIAVRQSYTLVDFQCSQPTPNVGLLRAPTLASPNPKLQPSCPHSPVHGIHRVRPLSPKPQLIMNSLSTTLPGPSHSRRQEYFRGASGGRLVNPLHPQPLFHCPYPTHPQGTRRLLQVTRVWPGKRDQQGMPLAASRGKTNCTTGQMVRWGVRTLSTLYWLLCPSAKGLAMGR